MSEHGEPLFSYDEFLERYNALKKYKTVHDLVGSEEVYDIIHEEKHANGIMSIKEHSELAKTYMQRMVEQDDQLVAQLKTIGLTAAKLHDLGKHQEIRQEVANLEYADALLDQVEALTFEERKTILLLIKYDELLGEILKEVYQTPDSGYAISNQGSKKMKQLDTVFQDPKIKTLLVMLYQSDVRGIGGSEWKEDGWDIANKLKFLDLPVYTI